MNYTMKAINTWYKGRLYRSRLEARWAAFFDLCGWQFEYEPIDLDGWFPDFAVYGKDGKPTYIEVKPVMALPAETAKRIHRAALGIDCELMILGQRPFKGGIHDHATSIGWHCERNGPYLMGFESGVHAHICQCKDHIGFGNSMYWYACRICVVDRTWKSSVDFERGIRLWNEAANVVRYERAGVTTQ